MDEPDKYTLVFAYLGDVLRADRAGATFDDLVPLWGISKPNLVKLSDNGTLGADLLFRLADARFSGQLDLVAHQARRWWTGLSPARQGEIYAWATAGHPRGGAPRTPMSEADRAEIRRLEAGIPSVTATVRQARPRARKRGA